MVVCAWSRLGRKAGGRRYKLGKQCVRVFINKIFPYALDSELGVIVTPGGVHLTLEHRLSSYVCFPSQSESGPPLS